MATAMKILAVQPKLVEQVYEAILLEIVEGRFGPGSRIIQDQIAQALGVSRQPIQQALLLLRNQGVLQDAPGRGLLVSPLDPTYVASLYDVRAMIEGLACRRAAERNAARAKELAPAIIRQGREAVKNNSVHDMVQADMALHNCIYELSENALIAVEMESHWLYARRIMGEVLTREEKPRDIWNQHESMVEAIIAGDADQAEQLAREHITQAADFMLAKLKES
jgi:DNA-binding GntR family transcriptional regulator